MDGIASILDSSVAAEGYVIKERGQGGQFGVAGARVDISSIDFDALRKLFSQPHRHIQVEKLRSAISYKLQQLVRLNKSRLDFLQEFQRMIDEYNSGSQNVEHFFEELVNFSKRLIDEERRHISEQLSEEELAVFDLLIKPAPDLTKKERQEVKNVARDLLATLKRERFVLDWRKRQQSRAAVHVTIGQILDQLPDRYDRPLYEQKCEVVYLHVYDSYFGGDNSVYTRAS